MRHVSGNTSIPNVGGTIPVIQIQTGKKLYLFLNYNVIVRCSVKVIAGLSKFEACLKHSLHTYTHVRILQTFHW